MASNGFADALEQLNTLTNVNKQVEISILKDAADYFVEQLRPQINMSDANKRTKLRNSLKVVVKDDVVQVQFEKDAWYWHLAEHGHKKAGGKGRVKGQHFVRNTFDSHGDKIAEIMAQKIIKKMEG